MKPVYNITEASLSRVWNHITSHGKVKSWGLISAFRAVNTKPENLSRNKEMESQLRKMNLGFFKVDGHWQECQNTEISWKDCPKEQLVDAVEQSFFIPNITKEQLIQLNKQYEQDAAVYGDSTQPGEAKLLFKNGEMEDIGKFHPDTVSKGYSSIRGSNFAFLHQPESPVGDTTRLSDLTPNFLNKKVKNPSTGRDIKLSSALSYDTNHPAYQLAQRIIQQQKKKSI